MSDKAPPAPATSAVKGFLVRLLATVIGGGISFFLAVIGWGGLGPFFAHPALIAVTVITAALILASSFTEGNLSTGVREDRANRWVVPVLAGLGFLTPWLCAFTDRYDFWTIDGDATRWTGVVIYAIGGALRIAPVFVLGKRFSGLVAIQPGHTLVTGGLYRYVRNPSYLGLFIVNEGWSLSFRSGVGLVLTVLMLIPIVARMNSEEKLLSSQFGSEYETYRARTWRLIPGLY